MKITENIELLNCDCMEYMRTLPDNAFDLAICDPPYGGGNDGELNGGGQVRGNIRPIQVNHAFGGRFERYNYPPHDGKKENRISWDIAPSEDYFNELFRVSRNQIIWGANYFKMPPTRCFVVWRKLTISEGFSMAMAEYAWTSFKENAKVYECMPQGSTKDRRFHPTQKPVSLYAWLLNNYAKDGDKILDTHFGSCSIGVACHNLGFSLTACEINETYFRKAVLRLKQHIRQQKLF